MQGFRSKQTSLAQPGYATHSDLCKHFAEDLQALYVLAFLLTGNHAEAESCFVTTLDDALRADSVFKGWERSWIKRCLIINAIRRVFSAPTASGDRKRDVSSVVDIESGGHRANAVANLAPPLQRLVFVISILEGYSEHECALLLGLAPRDVRDARTHALLQLSGVTPPLEKIAR